jgi:hypothetical protein
MKKIAFIFTSFLLFACSNEKTNDEQVSDETKSEKVHEHVVDPLKYDFSKPISAIELSESMKIYYGKQVQLVVYPISYYEKDKFVEQQACAELPDSDSRDIYLTFKTLPDIEFNSKKPYIIKGKIRDGFSFNNSISVYDVELVGELIDQKIEDFKPQTFNPELLYKASDIKKSMFAWNEKKVTVVGDFVSKTVSKSYDQTKIYEIRADISQDGGYDFVVGCAFDTDFGDKLQPGMQKIKIKGILDATLHYDRPYLKSCVIK